MSLRLDECRRGWRVVLSCLLLLIFSCTEQPQSKTATEEDSAKSSVTASSPPDSATSRATETAQARTSGRLQTGPGNTVLIEPALVDFGSLQPGSINSAAFRITNTATTPVTIRKATPSCVCTTLTDLAGRQVAPGETVVLEASLDAPKQAGKKDAKVFVYMDGAQRPAVVKMEGVVTLPVQPEPPYVDALKGKNAGSIRLRSTDGRSFRVISSNGGPPILVGGGDVAAPQHTVAWSVAGMPAQSIPRWWILTTDHPEQPLVSVRVRNENTGSARDPNRVGRRWIVLDDFIELGEVRVGDAREFTVQMDHYNPQGRGAVDRPQWSNDVKVSSADPRVTVSLGEISMVPKGDLQQGSIHAVVKVRFNGPPSELLFAPLSMSTATGTQILELAARVVQ